MEPKSFSATALQVAEACPSRYHAEHILRSKGPSGDAASLGTSVHGALELFVQEYMKTGNSPDLKYLMDMYKISFMSTFNTVDIDRDDFREGEEMMKKWFDRGDWMTGTVLSCEVKENFGVPTSIGEIPFNYIWDRFDQLDEDEYRVVDYKSNRWGIRPEDLKKKVQARCYAVAAQIKYPNAKRIWVEFDMLRHDGGVGVVFTREENIATWRFITALAQKIVDMDEDNLEERLNPECLFCVRKQSCEAVTKNLAVGGFLSVGSAEEAVDKRAMLEYQAKAIAATIKELDDIIMTDAKQRDAFEFLSDDNALEITRSKTRAVEPDFVHKVIGDDLFEKYGQQKITMGNVDKLLKGNEITAEQKSQLRGLIYNTYGEPKVKVLPRDPIGSM